MQEAMQTMHQGGVLPLREFGYDESTCRTLPGQGDRGMICPLQRFNLGFGRREIIPHRLGSRGACFRFGNIY